jgi:hypothetical protein
LKAYLVLGCNGFLDKNGILYCNSISNPIIDLEKLNELDRKNVLNFLEHVCNIFDKPCIDYNMVGNSINLLHKKFYVIDEKLIPSIQSFLRMHKTCGVYLMLVLKEDYDVRR